MARIGSNQSESLKTILADMRGVYRGQGEQPRYLEAEVEDAAVTLEIFTDDWKPALLNKWIAIAKSRMQTEQRLEICFRVHR